MTRIASDSGRNIYFVSESLKQIVTQNQERIKVFLIFNEFSVAIMKHFSLLTWV